MLDFFTRLAPRLHRFRHLAGTLAAVGLAIFIGALFASSRSHDDVYMLSGLALLLWAMLALTIGYGFATPPPVLAPDQRPLQRLQVRIRRAAAGLLAVFVTVLFALVVYATIRVASLTFFGPGN